MKRSSASGVAASLVVIAGLALTSAVADPMAIVAPLPPGAYPVGCSNVEQDFSRVQAGETAQQYWEGYPSGSRERYVAQLLADPSNVLRAGIAIPDDRELFVDRATNVVEYEFLVCYPTGAGNPYSDYPLPTGNAVPHMQRAAARIAGFGASLGGGTLLLQVGAKLTSSIGLSSKQVIADSRLKAIVGYVPYFGQLFFPACGRDQNGLDGIAVPFLGISGTADT